MGKVKHREAESPKVAQTVSDKVGIYLVVYFKVLALNWYTLLHS